MDINSMNLFSENTLHKKNSMKDYLKSNPRALSLQRSENVLGYFLRYGNGYKRIISDILEYDRVDCYGSEFRNTKDIWNDFMGNKYFDDDNFFMFIFNCFKLYNKEGHCKRFGEDYGQYLLLCEGRHRLCDWIEFYPYLNNLKKLRSELNSNTIDIYSKEVNISYEDKYIITLLDKSDIDKIEPRLMLEYMDAVNKNNFIRSVSFCVNYFYYNFYDIKTFNESKIILFKYCKKELFASKSLNKILVNFFESISDKFEFVDVNNPKIFILLQTKLVPMLILL